MSVLAGVGLAIALTAIFMACFWAANHLDPEDGDLSPVRRVKAPGAQP